MSRVLFRPLPAGDLPLARRVNQNAELDVELKAGIYESYLPMGEYNEKGMKGTFIIKEGLGGSGSY